MPAQPDLWSELAASMSADLFLLAGTLVFFAAVTHAFLCPSIARAAHVAEKKGGIKGAALHLLGEVEVVPREQSLLPRPRRRSAAFRNCAPCLPCAPAARRS
jgi:hypothetical protein